MGEAGSTFPTSSARQDVEQKSGLGAVHGFVLYVESLVRDLFENAGALGFVGDPLEEDALADTGAHCCKERNVKSVAAGARA